jgi:hypothetical protein
MFYTVGHWPARAARKGTPRHYARVMARAMRRACKGRFTLAQYSAALAAGCVVGAPLVAATGYNGPHNVCPMARSAVAQGWLAPAP